MFDEVIAACVKTEVHAHRVVDRWYCKSLPLLKLLQQDGIVQVLTWTDAISQQPFGPCYCRATAFDVTSPAC